MNDHTFAHFPNKTMNTHWHEIYLISKWHFQSINIISFNIANSKHLFKVDLIPSTKQALVLMNWLEHINVSSDHKRMLNRGTLNRDVKLGLCMVWKSVTLWTFWMSHCRIKSWSTNFFLSSLTCFFHWLLIPIFLLFSFNKAFRPQGNVNHQTICQNYWQNTWKVQGIVSMTTTCSQRIRIKGWRTWLLCLGSTQ